MKKVTLATVVILINASISFAQPPITTNLLQALLKRHTTCKFLYTKIKPNIGKNAVHDAAYAYHYWYPDNFKEVLPKDYSDTIEYKSLDKKAILKLWPGKTVNFPLGRVDSAGHFIGIKAADIIRVEKVVDDYIAVIAAGKEQHIGDIKIIDLCKGTDRYNFTINVRATDKQIGYIYKIEVSELPVSGDLIFKHFLFRYNLALKKEFENLGLLMADDFGM